MTQEEIIQTQEYKDWLTKLHTLDKHINSLPTWNDYAEAQQFEYDWLLKQDPRLKATNET